MKTIPAQLTTALQSGVLTLCRLIVITRTDGVVMRLTDAVLNVVIGGNTYRSDVGFSLSGLFIGLNMNQAQGFQLSVAMTADGVTKKDLRTRRYSSAKIEIFECDFTNPTNTLLSLFVGKAGRVTFLETGIANIDIIPGASNLEQFGAEIWSQTCRYSLGDARCTFPLLAFGVPFTVTAVPTPASYVATTFGPTAAATPAQDYFAFGQMKWLTGDNAEWELDIAASDFASRTIVMLYPPPSPIKVGDTGIMYPGCNLFLSTCFSKFGNSINFGGAPYSTTLTVA